MLGCYFLDELEVLIIIDSMWKFIKHETWNYWHFTVSENITLFDKNLPFFEIFNYRFVLNLKRNSLELNCL